MQVDDKIRELLEKAECVEHFYIKGEEFSILERRLYQKAISLLPKPCSECGGRGKVTSITGRTNPPWKPCPKCSPAGEIEEFEFMIKGINAVLADEKLWLDGKRILKSVKVFLEAQAKQIKQLEKTNNEFADGIETVNAACVKKTRLLQSRIEQLEGEKKELEEANRLLKAGACSYESQIRNMRKSLRNWCIANHIKLHDEGPDILLDN